MSKTVREQFKDNIPAVIRNNDLIESYADVVGEIFEEIRQEINYRAYETDYAECRYTALNQVASNVGLQLSPFLREEVIRRIIRDAPSVYSQMGTRGSLNWTLKNLGYRSFEIDEAWIPNPDLIRTGYFREIGSVSEPVRYNIRPDSYTDFVVGKEYVTDQGTFFKGHEYTDFEKNTEITEIPIYGEVYSTYTGLSFKDMVSKTPYIIVRLYDPPTYDEVITDTDPLTQEPITLSMQEKQRIINESVRYLIQELQRTATTSIILVGDLLIFDDLIDRLVEDYEMTSTQLPFVNEDTVFTLSEDPVIDSYLQTNSQSASFIGSKRPIGVTSPYPAIGQYVSNGLIGYPVGFVSRDIDEAIRGVNINTVVVNPSQGYEHVHFMDYGATVSFTAPSGVSIDVYSARNYHYTPTADRVFISTVSGGSLFNQTFEGDHAVILKFNNDFNGTLTISSTY